MPITPRSAGGLDIGRREPPRSIYGRAWTAAQHTLANAPPDDQPLLHQLLNEIEVGWVLVRPIFEIAHDRPDRIETSDAAGAFALETAEFFRVVAETCAGWLTPDHGRVGAMADTDSVRTELERFATHVAVLALAAHASGIDPVLDGVLQRLAREVAAWSDEMTRIVRRLGERWDLASE